MAFEFKAAIFIVSAIILAWLTRQSLNFFRSHGIYRYFTWLTVISLVLLNLEYWFVEPFSINQIVSWILLIVSIVLVVSGALSLYSAGQPNQRRNDSSLIGIEKTTELVTTGIYRYIRHPLYSSLIFGAWGIMFKDASLTAFCLAVVATVLSVLTAKKEEIENLGYFGLAYKSYMEKTKMFVPFII